MEGSQCRGWQRPKDPLEEVPWAREARGPEQAEDEHGASLGLETQLTPSAAGEAAHSTRRVCWGNAVIVCPHCSFGDNDAGDPERQEFRLQLFSAKGKNRW